MDTGTVIRNTDKQLVFLDDGCNRNRDRSPARLTSMLDRILSEGLKGKSRNQHWLRIFFYLQIIGEPVSVTDFLNVQIRGNKRKLFL